MRRRFQSELVLIVVLAVAGLAVAAPAFTPPRFIQSFGGPGTPWSLQYPRGLTIDRGYVYIADSARGHISIFTTDGRFVRQWGSDGRGNGQFTVPEDIAVANDMVFVADTYNLRVQVFSDRGTWLATYYGNQPDPGMRTWEIVSSIERSPRGILYILNSRGHHSWIERWLPGTVSSPMRFLDQFDLQSAGDPERNTPWHLTVGPDETSYVTYLSEQVIQAYSAGGQFLYQFGPSGAPDEQFHSPRGLALGPDGNLYITDAEGRIQVYTTQGTFVGHWGEAGWGDGQFQSPWDVVFDPTTGDVFVLEEDGSRVQRFAFPVAVEPTTWSRMKQLYRD